MPNMVKIPHLGPFVHHRTLTDENLIWFGCVIGGSAIIGKRGQRSKSLPGKMQ